MHANIKHIAQGEITIHGSFKGEGMTIYSERYPQGEHIPSLGGYSAAFTPQMAEFLETIKSEKRNTLNAYQALGEVLVAKATYKSVQSKKWEEVSLTNCTSNIPA